MAAYDNATGYWTMDPNQEGAYVWVDTPYVAPPQVDPDVPVGAELPKWAPAENESPTQAVLREEILAQGTTGNWSGQGFGSPEANADAMASVLDSIGVKNINEFGVLPSGEYGNKVTNQPVANTYGERQTGDAWGGTYAGAGNTGFRVQFKPDGTPVFYTSGQSSNTLAGLLQGNSILNLAANAAAAYFGGPLGTAALQLAQGNSATDAIRAGLMTYVGQQAAGAFGAGGSSGVSTATDASFGAADAAQLAQQGLSEAQIASTLTSSGMSTSAANLAASMAANGLSVDTITQQLNALSTNTGLMSQTGGAADFASADALQLKGTVGNNFASIEQNLIASGVDPLIAADISQQIAFNPSITQEDLANHLNTTYGDNIYDVNMATTYPTSVLPGQGGLLSQVPGGVPSAGGTTSPTAPTTSTGLTPEQISNIIKAGATLTGVGATTGLLSQGGSTTAPLQAPTQGMPAYGPEYYNQLQQYYNSYMPQTPRDVATPLQQWYNPTKAV